MAFELSSAQHKKLDEFLGGMLDGYKSGAFSKSEVIGALAHVFTAAVIDNEAEVKAWLERPEVLQTWKNDISTTGMK